VTEYRRFVPRNLGERVYRALLLAYPKDFRDEFGDAMTEFHVDRLLSALGSRQKTARVWIRAVFDTARNAPPARIDSLLRRIRRIDFHREDFMLSSIMQDIRYALRGMRRAPGFSLMVLATLTLGIGASVATYSAVNGVLLKPLPYRDPETLVRLDHIEPFGTVSEPEFVDYRRDMKSLATLAAYNDRVTLLGGSEGVEPERVRGLWVSDGFFQTLGATMLLGRPFSAEAERRGGPNEVVISHGLWMRRYGGDSAILGKPLTPGGTSAIVGVMAPGAEFPTNAISMWLPLRLNYDTLWTRNNHYLTLIGRLAPGATSERATAEAQTLAQRFTKDFPSFYNLTVPLRVRVKQLASVTTADVRPYLVTLFGAVLFVLAIACVNVANLLLSRGESRRKELAIRSAMGASGMRVARQAFTESLLFAVGGGSAGVALAAASLRMLRAFAPSNIPRVGEIALDWNVMAFALGVTIVTGMLFGMMPAMRSTRHDSAETLREGGKTAHSSGRGLSRLRRTLVMSEVALSVVTLSGAGLMLRSLWNLQAIDLGFRPDHVLAVQVTPPGNLPPAIASQVWRSLVEQTRAMQGVQAVGAVEDLPISDNDSEWSILIDNATATNVADAPAAMPQKVTVGYFDAMRIATVKGRVFDETDREDAALVAVVNETMAKQMWPGKEAIGGTVKLLNETMPKATVVGIVKDVRSRGFLTKVPPTMYFPAPQALRVAYYVPTQMWLITRTAGDPAAIAPQIRALVRRTMPRAAIAQVQTMDQAVARSVASRRFATALIAGFAIIALVLSGIGIFGVVAYSVNQRQFEIGLRLALGATPVMVVRQVLGEGLRTTVAGAVLGLIAGLGATRFLSAMFVEVKATDPVTMTSVAALLVLVALVASYVPARRASGVDPLTAIRAELDRGSRIVDRLVQDLPSILDPRSSILFRRFRRAPAPTL
jgi:putative ABC transport system permease protein